VPVLARAVPGGVAWVGYGVALLGIVFVARGGGGGASSGGDLLVLASVVMSAAMIAVQPRLLENQDAAAVTAVQFLAASLLALPIALISGGLPHAPATAEPLVAFLVLALVGTVVPFWLFAHGQKGTSAAVRRCDGQRRAAGRRGGRLGRVR
jgi:O-acetylserine/cysteine efflux transporter